MIREIACKLPPMIGHAENITRQASVSTAKSAPCLGAALVCETSPPINPNLSNWWKTSITKLGDVYDLGILNHQLLLQSVIPVTEVNLARAPRALEDEVRGGSSLEEAGKGRLWRKGSRKEVDGGRWRHATRQRALIPSFLPVSVLVNHTAVNQMDPLRL
jgi:hypothetical protein